MKSWDHFVALIYAQLSGHDSLRAVVTASAPTLSITIIWERASCPARHCQMPMLAVRPAFSGDLLRCCRPWRTGSSDAKGPRWCA
ncbi:DUF4372 domain-containing protein [Bradyrhizobium japonicum]|uniref:DUF4372 domain-containing protein n=1 Tax=Bradyrhizobium japonicum TaxID=375 RepID=UPI0009033B87